MLFFVANHIFSFISKEFEPSQKTAIITLVTLRSPCENNIAEKKLDYPPTRVVLWFFFRNASSFYIYIKQERKYFVVSKALKPRAI